MVSRGGFGRIPWGQLVGKKKRDGFPDDETLCDLKDHMKTHLEKYKRLVRDPKHVCRKCGRAAARAGNLCKPEAL